MRDTTPSWGVDPVPERLHVLSGLDSTLLWGNLSVSLLVIVAGALLVPALSLPKALLAILVGALAGNTLLGLAAMIGADARVPGMVLLRAPLGHRGSYLPTVLNVAQNLGWSIFELIIIATAAAALSQRLFGFHATLAVGARLRSRFARPGPTRPDRLRPPLPAEVRHLRPPRLDGVPDLVGADEGEPAPVLARARQGRLPDLRPGGQPRDRKRRLVDAARGRLHALCSHPARGGDRRRDRLLRPDALGLRARRLARPLAQPDRRAGDPDRGRGPGGVVALLALLAITIDESEKAFADIYSTAVSIQNLLAESAAAPPDHDRRRHSPPQASDRDQPLELSELPLPARLVLGPGCSASCSPTGSSRARTTARRTSSRTPLAFRGGLVAAWLAGFCLYQWLSPVGPAWWTRLIERTHPASVSFTASLPSFAASFAAALLALGLARVFQQVRTPPEQLAEP